MKIVHNPEIDYISIDFKEGIEAKSILKNGIIARFDQEGHVLGIDITDSSQFFSNKDVLITKKKPANY